VVLLSIRLAGREWAPDENLHNLCNTSRTIFERLRKSVWHWQQYDGIVAGLRGWLAVWEA
jgi:hypothetical protein